MVEKDDWRLTFGDEDYMYDQNAYHRKWVQKSKNDDHDHCKFCWAKFANFEDTLHEGYVVEFNNYNFWICDACFNDFKEMFRWTLVEEIEDRVNDQKT